jgi:hypothetical protein
MQLLRGYDADLRKNHELRRVVGEAAGYGIRSTGVGIQRCSGLGEHRLSREGRLSGQFAVTCHPR